VPEAETEKEWTEEEWEERQAEILKLLFTTGRVSDALTALLDAHVPQFYAKFAYGALYGAFERNRDSARETVVALFLKFNQTLPALADAVQESLQMFVENLSEILCDVAANADEKLGEVLALSVVAEVVLPSFALQIAQVAKNQKRALAKLLGRFWAMLSEKKGQDYARSVSTALAFDPKTWIAPEDLPSWLSTYVRQTTISHKGINITRMIELDVSLTTSSSCAGFDECVYVGGGCDSGESVGVGGGD